ncbi:CHAT domain-containing protein [Streptomyces sp. NA02950]|uniref:CHAT domain-containing protein n=1 Tax=Streptomyces sp. NA02950 TaxID=2742137 RepID=UPI00158FC348|nr:CHAT domain-containing protein [Streptomyces sp. NA02950]QKV95838.1 CHAT domain-containing protein [Streptomyces sp. NA02950]
MRDRLLAAVQSRLDLAVRAGDLSGVHAPQAGEEADGLLAFLATPRGVDAQVLYTAGLLHWFRAALPEEEGQESWALAVVLLMPFYMSRAEALPAPVRASFTRALSPSVRPAGEELVRAHAEAMGNLAMLLVIRLVRQRDHRAGQAGLRLLRDAEQVLPPGHPSRPLVLCNLGYTLVLNDLFAHQGEDPPPMPQLETAITVLREAFATTPRAHLNHARCANGLALGLRCKAILTQDRPLLGESVELLRTAVATATEVDENLPQMCADLGDALLMWAESGAERPGDVDTAVLDEAIAMLERAVIGLPDGSEEQDRAKTGFTRATMLRAPSRVREKRDPKTRKHLEVMDGFVSSMVPRQGGEGSGDGGHPLAFVAKLLGMVSGGGNSRSAQLMDFATTLMRYPDEAGLAEVHAKAMETLEAQFSHLPPGEREEAMRAYLDSAEEAPSPAFGPADTTELDALLEIHERVLRELPEDHQDRVMLTFNRRGLLLARLQYGGQVSRENWTEELAELGPLMTEAEGGLPAMLGRMGLSPDHMESWVMLAHAQQSPFEALARTAAGIRQGRRRLAALPADDPAYPQAQKALAHALFAHYQLDHDEARYQEAAGLARRVLDTLAATDPYLPFLLMAWGSAVTSRLQHSALTEDAETAEHALPSSAVARLASNSAADALGYRDAPGALEALEDGRAHLLSGALNARRELDQLRRTDAGLAARLVELREQVHDLQARGGFGRMPRPQDLAEYRDLAGQWKELMDRLQGMPGFERFLLPLPLGLPDLLPAAAEGPVISVNVNPRRCDALVLRPDGLVPVALPELRAGELIEQADAFHEAVAVLTHGGEGLLAGQARQVVRETLGWLWDVLAEPVLDALGLTGPPPPDGSWPRLWWSPTGPLNSLPLHAAGHHTRPGDSVLDRAVSSYTPTLRALLHSRAHPVTARRTALAVAMPETPGHAPLPRTVDEAGALAARTGGAAPLVGAAATREAVLAALPGAAVAHFACHAGSDPADPAASHLLLHDGPLSLTAISALHLDGAELAYLSACGTARGSARLADEAIHVASAFQLAGYAQAVATLWEIGDGVAAEVAAGFHGALDGALDAADRLPGALALHTVTRRMREAMPGEPWTWAALLHAGA